MVKYVSKYRVIIALVLVTLLTVVLISACDIGATQRTVSQPPQFGILTPVENIKVLVNGPVQIQSAFDNPETISRVELWIDEPDPEPEKLLRSDVPAHGVVLQRWVPQQTGIHTLKVKAVRADNQVQQEFTRNIAVIAHQAISLAAEAGAGAFAAPEATMIWATPTLTPTATIEAAGVAFLPPAQVIATATPTPSPTPTPYYPPPPPAPGVPPGPTQKQLPRMIPPVCDAAEFLRVFTGRGDTSRRIFIPTADMIPAKVAAGTTVHRAWEVRNIGTCTWGPNYELAFYGGRSMGSGGVAFESFFPSEPARRNAVIDRNLIIAPEGKPNQIAVLELLLNTPVIPGIHQSYWRLRNPQGVYFGPILGVTLEVVRDCNPVPGGSIIYGAPIINRFRILGADRELAPEGAGETVSYRTEVGRRIVLDWDVIDATNFDIVIEDRTGNIQSISTGDPTDTAGYTPTRVGDHTATLYADNGSCDVSQQLLIDVRPPEDEQFVLSVAFAQNAPVTTSDVEATFSSDVRVGTIQVDWDHFDNNVNNLNFHADRYVRRREEVCPIFDTIFGSTFHCYFRWTGWTLEASQTDELASTAAAGSTVCRSADCDVALPAVQETLTVAQHSSYIFCRLPRNEDEEVVVNYYVEAKIGDKSADPKRSNVVSAQCSAAEDGERPPVEIPEGFNP